MTVKQTRARQWANGTWLPLWYWPAWFWNVEWARAVDDVGIYTRPTEVRIRARLTEARPVDGHGTVPAVKATYVAEFHPPNWKQPVKV